MDYNTKFFLVTKQLHPRIWEAVNYQVLEVAKQIGNFSAVKIAEWDDGTPKIEYRIEFESDAPERFNTLDEKQKRGFNWATFLEYIIRAFNG